jgi:hypothetical protein
VTFSIDSGWIVSTTDECTCGMGRLSEYGHEAFCGWEQECPVEEFDSWVKHMVAQAEERGRAEGVDIQMRIDLDIAREDVWGEVLATLTKLRDENRQGTDPEWGVLNAAINAIVGPKGDSDE